MMLMEIAATALSTSCLHLFLLSITAILFKTVSQATSVVFTMLLALKVVVTELLHMTVFSRAVAMKVGLLEVHGGSAMVSTATAHRSPMNPATPCCSFYRSRLRSTMLSRVRSVQRSVRRAAASQSVM
jgi:hypothetical protein